MLRIWFDGLIIGPNTPFDHSRANSNEAPDKKRDGMCLKSWKMPTLVKGNIIPKQEDSYFNSRNQPGRAKEYPFLVSKTTTMWV